MKYFLWIIAIVVLVLLFPIPIKITLIYSEGIFTFKIYNKALKPSKNKKNIIKKKTPHKYDLESEESGKSSKLKLVDLKNIADSLINNKFKFSLRTKLYVEYAIEDAALNAIVYGLFYETSAILLTVLNLFFKVKNFAPFINTKYNESFFKFKSTSIIFINIAKVIFIFVSILNQLNKGRRKSPFNKVNFKEEF